MKTWHDKAPYEKRHAHIRDVLKDFFCIRRVFLKNISCLMVIFQRFMPVDMYKSSNSSLVFSYFFLLEKKMDGEMIIIYIKFISFYRRLLNNVL